jgi:hypothetical protein
MLGLSRWASQNEGGELVRVKHMPMIFVVCRKASSAARDGRGAVKTPA